MVSSTSSSPAPSGPFIPLVAHYEHTRLCELRDENRELWADASLDFPSDEELALSLASPGVAKLIRESLQEKWAIDSTSSAEEFDVLIADWTELFESLLIEQTSKLLTLLTLHFAPRHRVVLYIWARELDIHGMDRNRSTDDLEAGVISTHLLLTNFWLSCPELCTEPKTITDLFYDELKFEAKPERQVSFFANCCHILEHLKRTPRCETLFRLIWTKVEDILETGAPNSLTERQLKSYALLHRQFTGSLLDRALENGLVEPHHHLLMPLQSASSALVAGLISTDDFINQFIEKQHQLKSLKPEEANELFTPVITAAFSYLFYHHRTAIGEELLESELIEQTLGQGPCADYVIEDVMAHAINDSRARTLTLCWSLCERLNTSPFHRLLGTVSPPNQFCFRSLRPDRDPTFCNLLNRLTDQEWNEISKEMFSYSPLIMAIEYGADAFAQLLIQRSLELEKVGSETNPRQTALTAALEKGKWSIAKAILATGAPVPGGEASPLHTLMIGEPVKSVEEESAMLEVAQLLVEKSYPLDPLTKRDFEDLNVALKKKQYALVEFFLDLAETRAYQTTNNNHQWIDICIEDDDLPIPLFMRLIKWHLAHQPAKLGEKNIELMCVLAIQCPSLEKLKACAQAINEIGKWRAPWLSELGSTLSVAADYSDQAGTNLAQELNLERKAQFLFANEETLPLNSSSPLETVLRGCVQADAKCQTSTLQPLLELFCRTFEGHPLFGELFPGGSEGELFQDKSSQEFIEQFKIFASGSRSGFPALAATFLFVHLSGDEELATLRRRLLILGPSCESKSGIMIHEMAHRASYSLGGQRERWTYLLGDYICRQLDGLSGKELTKGVANHCMISPPTDVESVVPQFSRVLPILTDYLLLDPKQPSVWNVLTKFLKVAQQRDALSRELWIEILDKLQSIPNLDPQEKAQLASHRRRIAQEIQVETRKLLQAPKNEELEQEWLRRGRELKEELTNLLPLEKALSPEWNSNSSKINSLIWKCTCERKPKAVFVPQLQVDEPLQLFEERCRQKKGKEEEVISHPLEEVALQVTIYREKLLAKADKESEKLRTLPPFKGIVDFMKRLKLSPDDWNLGSRETIKKLIKENKQAAYQIDEIKRKAMTLRDKMRDIEAALRSIQGADEVTPEHLIKETLAETAPRQSAAEIFRARSQEIEDLKGKRKLMKQDLIDAQISLRTWHDSPPRLPESGDPIECAIALLKGERLRRDQLGREIVAIESLRAQWRNDIREEEYSASLKKFRKQLAALELQLNELHKQVEAKEEELLYEEAKRTETWQAIRLQIEESSEEYPLAALDAFFEPRERPTKKQCRELFHSLGFTRHKSDSKQGGTNHEIIDVMTEQGEIQLSLTGHKETVPAKWKALVEYRKVVMERLRYLLNNKEESCDEEPS